MPIYALGSVQPTLFDDGDPDSACWVAPSATVIGNVTLHLRSSVWFGAVIRGDNEPITVGEGSNVQDLAMCHTDPGCPLTIGKNCTIGHQATLHGCTIGDNSLVGMGAMVMNGAVIGQNCLIGANALVPEGKNIPDNSLVIGAPGKIIRQLDEAAIAGLRLSAEHYSANAKRFRSELQVVES